MKRTFIPFQNLSSTDKIKAIVTLSLMVVLLIGLGFLVGILLRPGQVGFSLPTSPVQATPTAPLPLAVPTRLAQTDCKSATLLLGGTTFQIQNLRREADGSLAIPADTSGIAYQIEGLGANPLFILSPSPQNISVMSTISIGSAAVVTAPDCSTTTYSLSAPQASSLDSSIFTNQNAPQITVLFPTTSSGAGFIFRGKPVTAPVVVQNQPTLNLESTAPASASTAPVENTTVSPVASADNVFTPTAEDIISTPEVLIPTPNYDEILAEIGLLDTTRSLFGINITISISVHNFGTIPITLTENDLALTQPDGTPVRFNGGKPSLPQVIQPDETKTFELTFKTPSTSTATLRVLTVEYDMDGY